MKFVIAVKPRCPYFFGEVPPLLHFRRLALGWGIRPLRNFSKFLVKLWHRKLGYPLAGEFGLKVGDGVRLVRVETINSHLETVLCWPHASYEPIVRALIDYFLPDDGVFFDVGANWGYYSFFVAARPGFTGVIHSFEPYPPTTNDFISVQSQSGLAESIHLHKMALSDHEGLAHMILPDRGRAAEASIRTESSGTAVTVSRLDALSLPDPDLIKLDVEGHELDMLRGAKETLGRAKPVIIFENWVHEHDADKNLGPIHYLRNLGYHIFAPVVQQEVDAGELSIQLIEIDEDTRSDFADVVDVCAVHRDRISERHPEARTREHRRREERQ